MEKTVKTRYFFAYLLSIFSIALINAKTARDSAYKVTQDNGTVQEIHSTQEFEGLLPQEGSFVAQFYNRECPVCQRFEASGIYQKTAQKYPAIRFVKVEKDLSGLHSKYGVMFYPKFIFFKDGKKVKELVGAITQERFERLLNQTGLSR